jgi:hypothetical protein
MFRAPHPEAFRRARARVDTRIKVDPINQRRKFVASVGDPKSEIELFRVWPIRGLAIDPHFRVIVSGDPIHRLAARIVRIKRGKALPFAQIENC